MRKGVVLAGFVLLIGIVAYLVTLMGSDDSRDRRGAASPSPARTHAGRSASAPVPDAEEGEIGFRLAVLAPGGAPAHRARVLSIYQLGFLGAAPLGTLGAGFLSSLIGPLATLHAAAALMTAVVALVWRTTDIAELD